MSIEIKICGINSKKIINTILKTGGCQYLGFVFYPPSPRNLSIEDIFAVVSETGLVHGVENLRVADASIMPDVVRANTNATVIMMAEKIADEIIDSFE